jgi:hypothetical protein
MYDDGFFSYIHVKYRTLEEYFGSLTGTFNAYIHKRDEINKKHESYYMRSEKLLTPNVSLANASYEIANSQFYKNLKDLSDYHETSYTCNLDFFLPDIILQIGALANRPSSIPTPTTFPSFEVRDCNAPLQYNEWTILALNETEISGKHFEEKKTTSLSIVFTTGDRPNHSKGLYARYLFKADLYLDDPTAHVPFDLPICKLSIVDTLERSDIIYVTPYVIKNLKLTVDSNIHNGFEAVNKAGEVIIRMITWKEQYYGSINDGTEVPTHEGVAVLIRSDYYGYLLNLYKDKGWFVVTKKDIKELEED